MIIPYLRSSSYNTFDFCQHKYYLSSVLCLEEKSNKRADIGTIVHKVMELLALRKLNQQNNVNLLMDEAIGPEPIENLSLTPDAAISYAWDFCTKTFTYHEWENKDFSEIKKLVYSALEYNDGMFSPLKLDIIDVERRFDIEINKPWAYWSFENAENETINGYLSLKGTMDLITRHDNNLVEIIDWKTGVRKNWNKNTDEKKEIADFENDPQLLLYFYAASRLYPEAELIFFTIFWIKDGGPFSIYFSKQDVERAENMIRERFEKIKDVQRPKLIYPNWKCDKLCYFNKTKHESGLSICQFHKQEVDRLGLDKATKKHANFDKIVKYGLGGGNITENSTKE